MGENESDFSDNSIEQILEESGLTVSIVQDWLKPIGLSLPENPLPSRMRNKIDFEEKQFALRQRIEELREKTFQPEFGDRKERSLTEAQLLVNSGKFEDATKALDEIELFVSSSQEQKTESPGDESVLDGLSSLLSEMDVEEKKDEEKKDEGEKTDEDEKKDDEEEKDEPEPVLLPEAPLDAINSVLLAGRTAQDVIRRGADELLAIQDRYLTAQRVRAEKTNPSEEFTNLSDQMSQALEEFKTVNVRCGKALSDLKLQEQLLGSIDVDQPNTPLAAKKLHAKAEVELAGRVKKATSTCGKGVETESKLAKAFREDEQFLARDGVKLYEPDTNELPSILRDLTPKIIQTTRQFNEAKRPLASALLQLNDWLGLVSKGRQLPDKAGEQINKFELEANSSAKNFGKWNAAINNPWKSARNMVKPLKKQDHLETIELFWRGEKHYDQLSSAYGEADEAAKSVIFIVSLLKLASKPLATPAEANDELKRRLEEISKQQQIVVDPIGRLSTAKEKLADKKKAYANVKGDDLSVLESALTDLNQIIEKAQANILALERGMQTVNLVGGLIKTHFSVKGIDKKNVEKLKKATAQLERAISPALKEGGKTVSALIALRDKLMKQGAALGKPASVEDTVRLKGVLKEMPPLPGKGELFPAKGVSKWKAATAKGGDKKSTQLFAAVIKEWEGVEKSADDDSLDRLESAAANYLLHYEKLVAGELQNPGNLADVDTARATKCREAQKLIRKMRVKLDCDSIQEPPWTEAQAIKAKRVEAFTLLETGTPAKAPKAKGESDSFFINNSEGRPAFIFKPKQGENVKQDLGGREGDGVVREVLTSKFNDQMREMIGVDFGVSPTGIARLESDSFANGEKSKEKSRVGALQHAIPNEGSLLDKLTEDPGFAKTVKKEDVQKVALMDFLTLQGDRNAGNLLVQDVGGEKRLVPIDGGFAFPSAELFGMASSGMGGQPMDVDAPAPTSEEEREKAKGGLEGKNALMLLPQSQEKFSDEMLKSLESLDPKELVKGLKKSNSEISESAPEVSGLVGDENLENVRRSAVFLKKAAPLFTVSELGEIYATDFKRVLAAPPKQLDKEITAVINVARKRSDMNKSVKESEEEYKKLGGDDEIVKLGWNPKLDRMLRLNWKRKIEILKKREQAPQAKDEPVLPKPPSDEESLTRELKALGGDKELQKVLQRPDGNKPKLPPNPTLSGKVGRLRTWKQYKDLGGDKGFDKVVKLYEENKYVPFGNLPKPAQAAVATFATWQGDPYDLGLGSKTDALKDFTKFKK